MDSHPLLGDEGPFVNNNFVSLSFKKSTPPQDGTQPEGYGTGSRVSSFWR